MVSNQGSHHVSWKPGRLVIVPQPGAIVLTGKRRVEQFNLLLFVAGLKAMPDTKDNNGFIFQTIPHDIAALAERDE